MSRLWKTRLTALLLTLALTAGMAPAALAAGEWKSNGNGDNDSHTHFDANGNKTIEEKHNWGDWTIDPDDSSRHTRSCLTGCGAKQTAAHTNNNTYDRSSAYHWKVCSVCGAEISDTRAEHTMEQKSDAGYHWKQCKACGLETDKGGHIDADNNGKCDTCSHAVTVNYTVTFQTPASNTHAIQTVASGSAPGNPQNPADYTTGGKVYAFKGWTTTYTGNSSWYVYTNQTLVTPSSQKVTGNVTYYAVYTEVDRGRITYTVASGDEVEFDISDFNDVFRTISGSNRSIRWVRFTVPNSYSSFRGTLCCGSETLTRGELNSKDFYYSDEEYGEYDLSGLIFQADSGARDGDTLTISFTAYYSNSIYADGTVEIIIDGDFTGDIVYTAAPGEEVSLRASDFNSLYQRATDYDNRSISWVSFTAPSSYTGFQGALYSNSAALTRNDLNNKDFYYKNKAYGDYNLDSLTFQAGSDARDGSRLRIPFRAYYSTTSYVDGTLELVVDKNSGGDVVYTVTPGKTVDFDRTDFNAFFRRTYGSSTLSYVVFDRPASDAFADGTLYCDYGSRSAEAFTRSDLHNAAFYYTPGSSDYGLDDLTFAADTGFQKTLRLTFTAYGSGSKSVDGTLVIRPATSGGDITYTVAPGEAVDFKRTDFNSFFRKAYQDTLYYVVFDRPATDAFADGALYCGYDSRDETAFTRSSLNGVKFYYYESDAGRNGYYLDDLSFVAESRFSKAVSLTFTAYGDDEDDYVKGTLTIAPDAAASVSSHYVGSVRYATTTGANVRIDANDLARYYARSCPGKTLQYVIITGVPAAGALYYNYYNTSGYGSGSQAVLTAANCAGQAFYASPSSASQFSLADLTYVPSGANYCVTIPFTAYGSGPSVSGSILISVTTSSVSEVYGVITRNTPVTFPALAIFSAVQSASGAALSGIQLLALPDSTAGTVYVGSGTSRKADVTTVYSFSGGAQQMDQLRFVPATGFTGSVTIPYIALNASGAGIASGVFSLGVVTSEKKFSDVTNSTWCYKYVAELAGTGIIDGYSNGSFKPDSTITYGAALKLIMLAAGYPQQVPTGSNAFSGYLDRARADGIITRSDVNLSTPITRLQVAQLAAGALKLDTGNLSNTKPFTDTSDVYVQALSAAGIVNGYYDNGVSTFRPNNTLTRGQISAIVWRMYQYQK